MSNLLMNLTDLDLLKWEDLCVIYRIYHAVTNKGYIGKCEKGLNRVLDHLKCYKRPRSEYRAKLLYRAMNKHGIESFKYEILQVCEKKDNLDELEIFFIKKFDSTNPLLGYNITEGGTGGNTWKNLSEEDKKRAKAKVSAAVKMRYVNAPETRLKASTTLKLIRSCPVKSLKNREIAKNRLTLLNKTDPRFNNGRKKKIKHLETGKEFNSVKECTEYFNISSYPIRISTKYNKKTRFGTFAIIKKEN